MNRHGRRRSRQRGAANHGPAPALAWVVLLGFAVLTQGCQFLQNEFWNY